MRIDKYLKVSRLIKRRTVANEVADAGRILVNGKPAKASYAVKEGDEIPAFVQELERMQSYRKRQAAICLLGKMRKMPTSDALRAKIQAELEGLAEDPVNNVALTAKHVLANE